MAQEVLERQPLAVGVRAEGYYRVDYPALGFDLVSGHVTP